MWNKNLKFEINLVSLVTNFNFVKLYNNLSRNYKQTLINK